MRRADFDALSVGLGNSLAVGVGYLPIAFSFGVAAVQAGLSPALVMLVSLVVYAGASQFLLISLLASGAGLVTAVPAVLLMNARHALYGPALVGRGSQRHSRLSSPWLAFGLTDEVFATALSRISSIPPQHRDHWLLGLQVGAYVAWAVGTGIGVVFVRDVENWPAAVRDGMEFVLPALFFSLLLDTGLRRWRLPVVAAAGVSALLGVFVPSHHALALGIVAGALSHALFSRLPR